jgi:alpha-1,2-mannosyltransferase
MELSKGKVGLHTMTNEHFGISLVEYMAAGLITLGHRSGGPLMDIIDETIENRSGFLADTEESYVDALKQIFRLGPNQLQAIQSRARTAATTKFSGERFMAGFMYNVRQVID